MKKLLILLLAVSLLLSGCDMLSALGVVGLISMTDRETPKATIFAYVTENQAMLESLDNIPKDYTEQESFVKAALGENTFVNSIRIESNDSQEVIEFSCNGSGNATNSIYVGFYYSETDTPYPICFDTETLTETSPHIYEWENEAGDHKIYTERITENWFYYRVQYF